MIRQHYFKIKGVIMECVQHICFLVFCFYYNRITRYFNNQRKMYLIYYVLLVDS